MAQAGFTPIQLYHSATPAAVPAAADLVAGELAVNTADGILFYEDSAGVVKPLAHNVTPVANGGTGVTTSTGTGNVVLSNSPTLVTPALGTPQSGALTNCTGLPTAGLVDNAVTNAKLRDSAGLSVIGRGANSTGDPADIVAGTNHQVLRRDGSSLAFGAVDLSSNQAVTGTLPVNQGGTGITSFGSGIATWLGTPSSANLAAAVTDETGTGALVFANSPTLVTPALGTPSALVGTNITGTAAGLTAGNVTTNANLTGAVTSTGNATVLGSFTSADLSGALTDETGTGAAVFGTSPTLGGTVVDNTTNLVTNANIGTAPNQAPLNATLGALAYQDVIGVFAATNVTPTIASAATIQPTAPITFISGTTNVVTITAPPSFVGGGQITLIPTGLWSTTTAGNIALATTAVVSKALIMTYDTAAAKWYPSY